MTRVSFAALPDDAFVPASLAADLLATGTDSRLTVDAATRLDKYGCSVLPRLLDGRFSSSTASSLSPRGLARVEAAIATFDGAATARGAWEALDRRVQDLREEFCDLLGLCVTDADVVFCPSGTDAQLQAVGVVKALLGAPLVSVIVAADETGSGTRFTAAGRHFLGRTAQGVAVKAGRLLDGMEGLAPTLSIAVNSRTGPRSLAEIDDAVIAAVAGAARDGCKVLLQAMNASKLGRRYPSDGCLDLIRRRWSGTVQIVVDACQMRLSPHRLRHHLAHGDMVLVTGSKFFTGPPFSGALLLPTRLRLPPGALPKGLADYASRQDWPSHHRAIREALPCRPVLGPWLRWEAAMAEMAAYFAVPPAFRYEALRLFEDAADALTRAGCRRPSGSLDDLPGNLQDEEFAIPSIFPFLVAAGTGWITPTRAATLHADLNRDMAADRPAFANATGSALASRLIHIGQPVALPTELGPTAVLRVSADARFVVDCWQRDPARARRRVEDHLGKLRLAFEKLEWLQSAAPGVAS